MGNQMVWANFWVRIFWLEEIGHLVHEAFSLAGCEAPIILIHPLPPPFPPHKNVTARPNIWAPNRLTLTHKHAYVTCGREQARLCVTTHYVTPSLSFEGVWGGGTTAQFEFDHFINSDSLDLVQFEHLQSTDQKQFNRQ